MLSYSHYTQDERKCLQQLLEEGHSLRYIAKATGRSVSSVSREIKRNRSRNGYGYWYANNQAIYRRRKSHPMKRLEKNAKLGVYVREKLALFWSPECIAETWNLQHPDDRMSFATIYRWLKKGALPGFSRKTHLRRRGKKIQTRNANYMTIHPDRLIEEWPDVIVNRERIGDWEGDTVCGAVGKGRIVTFADRKSRFLCASKLATKRPEDTRLAIRKALKDVPVCSLSLDNGTEFAAFREVEKDLNSPIYFAKPHAPWQRGSNENINGLLRFFFPKGCDFLAVTDEHLQAIVDLINNRPRKCLGWKSPAEVFFASLNDLDYGPNAGVYAAKVP